MKKRRTKKSLLHDWFYNPDTLGFKVVNDFLAFITIVSVLSIILETVPSLSAYEPLFNLIEYTTVFFFTLEYLARVMAERKDFTAYIFSFFGLIDLLAIIPSYIGFSNLTFLKTARVLRILRLLRMIRLAKVTRLIQQEKKELESYRVAYRLNIGIYFFALLSATIIFGTLIYITEHEEAAFSSIPLGMLWSIKPIMGGVAQTEPMTIFGQIIAVSARFTGLVLFGLLIAIVGNGVKKLLFGSTKIE